MGVNPNKNHQETRMHFVRMGRRETERSKNTQNIIYIFGIVKFT